MKHISTLVQDIHDVMGAGDKDGFDLSLFSSNLANAYTKQVGKREERIRPPNTLYFSEIGEPCQRKMWYKYNDTTPEVIEPATRIKFLYGDMLEELVLQLAEDAGHSVTDRQAVVEYNVPKSDWTIRGRIDAIIDGAVVDVKSVTKLSEQKFHNALTDDPFGYFGQLNGYASVLKNKDMGFLTIQKELGHINYFPFTQDNEAFAHNVARAVGVVSCVDNVFDKQAPVPASATSPNMKLCTACSYCGYKKKCFPEVRGFAYSNKVEWLTEVNKLPNVPEITE